MAHSHNRVTTWETWHFSEAKPRKHSNTWRQRLGSTRKTARSIMRCPVLIVDWAGVKRRPRNNDFTRSRKHRKKNPLPAFRRLSWGNDPVIGLTKCWDNREDEVSQLTLLTSPESERSSKYLEIKFSLMLASAG